MTKIAFIGLGTMGGPMAANLVTRGFEVTGYNRSPESVDRLIKVGGNGATNVRDAMEGADIVATMLPDTPDVITVTSGPQGILEHAPTGMLMIDFSTIRPDAAQRLFHEGELIGVDVLDAPVSGGRQGAVDAALSIMVGGGADTFAKALPVFEAVGKTIVHVGPAGAGQTVKAANQLVVAGTIELLAEAVTFIRASNVDLTAAIRALSAGLAGSNVLSRKSQNMIDHDFEASFRLALHNKDLQILTAAAAAKNVTIPVGSLVAQLMNAADAQGYGQLDHSALLMVIEQLSGI